MNNIAPNNSTLRRGPNPGKRTEAYISILCSQTVRQHLLDAAELAPIPRRFDQLAYLLHLQSRMRTQLSATLPHDGHHPGTLEGIDEELHLSLQQAEHGAQELETLAASIAQMDTRLTLASRELAITRQRESARSAAEETRLALT